MPLPPPLINLDMLVLLIKFHVVSWLLILCFSSGVVNVSFHLVPVVSVIHCSGQPVKIIGI